MPLAQSVERVKSVGKRCDGDGPEVLQLHQMIDRRESRRMGKDAAAWHQERGSEGMRLALNLLALWFAVAVQDEVPQLVSGIEAAVFGRFHRVQENERSAVVPHREGVNFPGVDRQ